MSVMTILRQPRLAHALSAPLNLLQRTLLSGEMDVYRSLERGPNDVDLQLPMVYRFPQ
jgi:hypothetical protein